MGILFTNNANSTLASGISNSDLSLTVQTGTGALFPNPTTAEQYFLVTLEVGTLREIVKVTSRSTDVLTIVRAQEGTTAQTWSAGTKVSHRITAGSLSAIGGSVPDYIIQSYGVV